MSARTVDTTDPLAELVDLLTSHDLEAAALSAMVAAIRDARNDPELDWMDAEATDEEWMQIALQFALIEFIAMGDKVDELHEQISDCFSEPLDPYPHQHDKMDFLPADYFRWLDERLATRNPAQGGYELVLLDSRLDDNVHALVVYRSDTPRIVALATQLLLRIDRATSIFND